MLDVLKIIGKYTRHCEKNRILQEIKTAGNNDHHKLGFKNILSKF